MTASSSKWSSSLACTTKSAQHHSNGLLARTESVSSPVTMQMQGRQMALPLMSYHLVMPLSACTTVVQPVKSSDGAAVAVFVHSPKQGVWNRSFLLLDGCDWGVYVSSVCHRPLIPVNTKKKILTERKRTWDGLTDKKTILTVLESRLCVKSIPTTPPLTTSVPFSSVYHSHNNNLYIPYKYLCIFSLWSVQLSNYVQDFTTGICKPTTCVLLAFLFPKN